MAIPRVFISSTCYDLKYIRENLKYFIRTIGYEPVLSEEGAVFYDPAQHTHDSCIVEVPNCQLFVLIIGGRYGGDFKGKSTSITNEEYREAIRQKIPVFALVESNVYSDHYVYSENKTNKKIDASSIIYPSIEKNNTKIFDFIDEVRKQAINNAIVPFKDFNDIESYLRQQWAGMMFSFLTNRNEALRVADMMSNLLQINERVEFLSSQVLKSVGSKESNILVKLYDIMLDNSAANVLLSTGHKPDPISVLSSKTLEECAKKLGKPFEVKTNVDFITTGSGEIEKSYLKSMEIKFKELKDEMNKVLADEGISIDQLLESQKDSA